MAAPHVAGLAALALSANQSLTAAELRNVIVNGANRVISGSDALGGINAALTVALAAAGQVSSSSAISTTPPTIAAASVGWWVRNRWISSSGVEVTQRAVQTGVPITHVADARMRPAPAATLPDNSTRSTIVQDQALLGLFGSPDSDTIDDSDQAAASDSLCIAALRFAIEDVTGLSLQTPGTECGVEAIA